MINNIFILLPHNGIGGSQSQFIMLKNMLQTSRSLQLFSLRPHSLPHSDIQYTTLLDFYFHCFTVKPAYIIACNTMQFIVLLPILPFFRIVLAERNCPSSRIKRERLFSRFRRRISYLLAYKVSVQTTTALRYVRRFIRSDVVYTPNLFSPTSCPDKSISKDFPESLKILCVGTKPYQKGFDLSIDIFNYIQQLIGYQSSITFVGINKDQLENAISDSKTDLTSINCISPTRSLANIYSSFSFLLLTSRFEGYPNVIDEALDSNLPVVIYKTPFLRASFAELPSCVLYCTDKYKLTISLLPFLREYYLNQEQNSLTVHSFLYNKNSASLTSWLSILS